MGQQEKEPIVSNMYDGKGNVVKVVTTENSKGRAVQSTGETVEDALDNVDKSEIVGKGFSEHQQG